MNATDAKNKIGDVAAHAKDAALPPVEHAIDVISDKIGDKAGPLAHQAASTASKWRTPLLIGAAAIVVIGIARRATRQL